MRPKLLRSGLTETIYIVTRYREKVAPNGKPYLFAQTKYEVSDEDLAAIGLQKMGRVQGEEPK